jgi:hypothetical protein
VTSKRVPISRSPARQVTARAINLFKYLCELEDNGVSIGSREYNAVALELHREFGRGPWDVFVTDVGVADEPPNETGMKLESWLMAVELRRALEAAILPPD